jgi:hypothetical protein
MTSRFKHKCGDIREDGMVFWSYGPLHKNGEYWISQEKFEEKKSNGRAYQRKLRSQNKEHFRQREKEYRIKNKDKISEYRRRDKKKNKERYDAYKKQWRKNNPDSSRNTQLKKCFGITLCDYNQMLESQNGVCKICKQKCSSGKNLAVDHCHKTGIVRGLLCGNCNKALGLFQESSEIVKMASEYIKQFEM